MRDFFCCSYLYDIYHFEPGSKGNEGVLHTPKISFIFLRSYSSARDTVSVFYVQLAVRGTYYILSAADEAWRHPFLFILLKQIIHGQHQ